ncbi:MAG: ISKra4 family transposase, partial [Sulfitobacter sp.]
MDVRIVVETTFEDGETQRRNIGRLCRAPDNLESESLGLRLDEAKNLLAHLQEVFLCNQIDEALAASRICDDCVKRLAMHDDRGRTLDTLYGRFRVKAPRL